MLTFIFTKIAEKQLRKLDEQIQSQIQSQILAKLKMFKEKSYFISNTRSVIDIQDVSHRVRVGRYRILLNCDFKSGQCLITRVGHRKDVYR